MPLVSGERTPSEERTRSNGACARRRGCEASSDGQDENGGYLEERQHDVHHLARAPLQAEKPPLLQARVHPVRRQRPRRPCTGRLRLDLHRRAPRARVTGERIRQQRVDRLRCAVLDQRVDRVVSSSRGGAQHRDAEQHGGEVHPRSSVESAFCMHLARPLSASSPLQFHAQRVLRRHTRCCMLVSGTKPSALQLRGGGCGASSGRR